MQHFRLDDGDEDGAAAYEAEECAADDWFTDDGKLHEGGMVPGMARTVTIRSWMWTDLWHMRPAEIPISCDMCAGHGTT